MFGAAPQFAYIGDPGRVEHDVLAIVEADGTDTVVELVGRDIVDAFVGHCHGGISLESGSAEHGDEHRSLIFADATTVGEVHLGIVEGIAFALSHTDAGIAYVVGNPMGKDADRIHLGTGIGKESIDLELYLGSGAEAAIVLVDIVEPTRFGLPVGGGRKKEFTLDIIIGQCVRFAMEGLDIILSESVGDEVVGGGTIDRQGGVVVDLELETFGNRDRNGVDLGEDRVVGPERDDVVEMAAHRRNKAAIVVGQEGIGKALAIGDIVNDVAGVEVRHLDHLLAGAPIDEASGSNIVVDLSSGVGEKRVDAAIGVGDDKATELDKGRLRVVVEFDDSIVAAAYKVVDQDTFVRSDMTQTTFLHNDEGRVDKSALVLLSRESRKEE